MEKKRVKKTVSVLIPVRNEEASLRQLVSELYQLPIWKSYILEVVAVDDYSSDTSLDCLYNLQKEYKNLHVHKKQGVIGKGASLLEGIHFATGEIVITIDADLAFETSSIETVLTAITDSSADIVVGNRVYEPSSQTVLSRINNWLSGFIGRLFFGISTDYQSGLKAYRAELLKNIELQPTKWSFDLELTQKAVSSGHTILSVPVPYKRRVKNLDTMNAFQAAIELTWMAIMLRIAWLEPIFIPNGKPLEAEIGWNNRRYKPYTDLHHEDSAIKTITTSQVFLFIIMCLVIGVIFVFSWHIGLIFIITMLSILYFSDLLFQLFLIINSLRNTPEIKISKKQIGIDREWPLYTIICPLYKEWQVVPQFVEAMQNMNYPKDRLQVIISLEEDDKQTQKEISQMDIPSYFQILVTPHHQPKTKPKACNYALIHSKGEYVVIYDAEDIPDVDQLKKAVIAFEDLEKEQVVCIQSKLNFYNTHQNLLTRFFTLEYSLWFDLVLTGLHSIDAPIPLGGTSNHFHKKHLNLLQGWDPFNVTEDCDLGIRLFKYGYKTKILDSTTWEEANSSFWGWFPQRSRWIKGYIQTYLVHMRRPHEFITGWNNPHILTFQLIVGGKVLSMWINPFLWILTITYFAFRPFVGAFIESLYLTPIFYLAIFSLVFGNFLYFYYYMIGAAKREQWDLVKYAFLVPIYWLMMSVASWKALYQIMFKPHYWEKTTHGLHIGKHKIIIAGN